MKLPYSYSYSLGLWVRMRGSPLLSELTGKGGGKRTPKGDNPASQSTVGQPIPSWLPGFFGGFGLETTTTHSKLVVAKESGGCADGSAKPPATKPECAADGKQPADPAAPCLVAGKPKDESLQFENMSLEEFAELFPEDALNTRDRPTFWPHAPEDQLTAADERRSKKDIF